MKESVGTGESNHSKMVRLTETSVNRLLGDKHANAGYIILSASRGGISLDNPKQNEINNANSKTLRDDIKKAGFTFVPVYGGYREKENGEERDVYEYSYFVFNFDRDGNQKNFEDLYKFGLAMCAKYNQDSILVKAPNDVPKYINRNGEVEMEFNGSTKLNDMAQQYFTSIVKTKNMDANQEGRKDSRFSFMECYINPAPETYNERHIRYLNGETFLIS